MASRNLSRPICITFSNEKGGVGKTSLAVNTACVLALRGWRVMILDADPQGHAGLRLGIKKDHGLYDLLVRDADWREVSRRVSPERYGIPGDVLLTESKLWVVPSNIETRNVAGMVAGDAPIVRHRVDELAGIVDFVIVDTSPTPSHLHAAFYAATDYIIYPTELSITSFDGLVESLSRRDTANKARVERWGFDPIKVAGIVPTKFRGNTVEQAANLEQLKAKFGGRVWHPIPLRTVWLESETDGVPVYNLDPSSPAALDVFELGDRVEGILNVQA